MALVWDKSLEYTLNIRNKPFSRTSFTYKLAKNQFDVVEKYEGKFFKKKSQKFKLLYDESIEHELKLRNNLFLSAYFT